MLVSGATRPRARRTTASGGWPAAPTVRELLPSRTTTAKPVGTSAGAQAMPEIFSISAVVEMAGVRGR